MEDEIIPAGWRKPLYRIYALLGLALGATQVGFASADAGQPIWLTVSLAVFAFVGTGFGFVAQRNTPSV
ncbi:MAG: hypothetical protein BGN98_13875 [Microbacterium sp. 69-7]|mgnify:CR=1 FL=1|uniref:hypothetical protein n=1 Tax=Microbacterium sp. 69-7 TaxID=1895784 RepID=UPI00095E9D5C|nr:hypothetical protein [Microbacterium sp. 69-7]OJU44468.1 MAG: hypothetical protein BGN98_13875 [Microbacterium sp. 69-7]